MNNDNTQQPETANSPTQATGANNPGEAMQWYYLVGDKTCGPKTTEEIRGFIKSDALPNSTFVFREGMKDWATANALEDFQDLAAPNRIQQAIPPNVTQI